MWQDRLIRRLEEIQRERKGRLREISCSMGEDPRTLASRLGKLRQGNSTISLAYLRKLSKAINCIPIAFYIEKTREIETLDNPSFINGQFPPCYVGKTFQKHRELANLTEEDLEQRIAERTGTVNYLKKHTKAARIRDYEQGTKPPSIGSVEYICDALGLIPAYLIIVPAPTKLALL